MSDPFDLESALDQQEMADDQRKDREYEAYLAGKEIRDHCSPFALDVFCREAGIRLPDIEE